jgi:putative NADH-flavin reductase
MKLTIFAATGGVGREVLEQAVAADLSSADPAALESAVGGADAVLSGLGPHANAEAGVAWRGTQAIVQAMKATDVRRIVVVSAAPVATVASPGRPNPPKLNDKPMTGTYRTAYSRNVRGGWSVLRADVANCMLRVLGTTRARC